MKRIFSFLLTSTTAKALMVVGGGVWLIGEVSGASNKSSGDTFSEWFKGLPRPMKDFLFVLMGIIICHFAEWRIGSDTTNVAGDINIEVKEN